MQVSDIFSLCLETKNLKVQPSAQTHAQEQATAIIAATVSLAHSSSVCCDHCSYSHALTED